MPTTYEEIVAELATPAECDDLTAYLTADRAAAIFLQSSATQSLNNYAPAPARATEIADLTTSIAADQAALPSIADVKRRLRAERDINDQESRLLTLRQQALTQGGDDRARRLIERNQAERRIADADALLPLIAARKPTL
ncbi:hypothetical protein [Hymenobacter terrenus]|uniref:hypothetical protein n=1 Tax=Hymenobacter terrenus TaxID=1629124 RepID=UPI0006191BF3|nr:hypothetical protein [Hymenobacter terrenus]